MPEAPAHPEEERRLAALHALRILDTDEEERFDRITRLARRMFGTEMAAVTLIDADRQWFKSEQGLDERENSRETSFCSHAILGSETLVVPDASTDERFADNPLVTEEDGIRFYAGHPVSAPGGEPLGTLCVIGREPKEAEEFDAEALRELAEMVEGEVASLSLAIGDGLTGLSNRRGFEMLGERLLRAADRLELPVAAIYADLDNMKPINDTHGHEIGDMALREVGWLLEGTLRNSDLIARLGGDEFCALLVDTGAGGAAEAAARLEAALAKRNRISVAPYELSISLGVAESTGPGRHDLWELVAAADARMLEAKAARKAGRGEVARAS